MELHEMLRRPFYRSSRKDFSGVSVTRVAKSVIMVKSLNEAVVMDITSEDFCTEIDIECRVGKLISVTPDSRVDLHESD